MKPLKTQTRNLSSVICMSFFVLKSQISLLSQNKVIFFIYSTCEFQLQIVTLCRVLRAVMLAKWRDRSVPWMTILEKCFEKPASMSECQTALLELSLLIKEDVVLDVKAEVSYMISKLLRECVQHLMLVVEFRSLEGYPEAVREAAERSCIWVKLGVIQSLLLKPVGPVDPVEKDKIELKYVQNEVRKTTC